MDGGRNPDRGGGRRRAVGGFDGNDLERRESRLEEALRVRDRVAAAAVRQSEDVGKAAELLDDLECCGLLTFDPVRVRRVDHDRAFALGELLGRGERVVERSFDLDQSRTGHAHLGELRARGPARRVHDDGLEPCPCGVRSCGRGRVSRRCAGRFHGPDEPRMAEPVAAVRHLLFRA